MTTVKKILSIMFLCTICTVSLFTQAAKTGIDSSWDYELFTAVKNKDMRKVISYLKTYDANPNAYIKQGAIETTALCEAVRVGDPSIVRALFEEGRKKADPNQAERGAGGKIPIIIAAQKNDLTMLRVLVEFGANLDTPMGETGKTLLMELCGSKEYHYITVNNIVSLVFNNRPFSLETLDSDMRAAIHYAATSGNFLYPQPIHDRLLLLLSRNADVNQKDRDGNTALHYVAMSGDVGSFILLCSDIDMKVNVPNNKRFSPLGLLLLSAYKSGSLDSIGENLAEIVKLGARFYDEKEPQTGIDISGLFAQAANVEIILDYYERYNDISIIYQFFQKNKRFSRNAPTYKNEKKTDNMPLLCYAVDKGWEPDAIRVMIEAYDGDWKTIVVENGKYRNMNAYQIMQRKRSENRYQAVFDEFMY